MGTCGSCGADLADGSRYCSSCGSAVRPATAPIEPPAGAVPPPPPPPPPGYGYPQPAPAPTPTPTPGSSMRTNGFAIAALVLGCVGAFTCGIGSILAVIFGFIGRSQIAARGEQGKGMALAGIILGFVGIAIIVIWVIVAAATSMGTDGTNQNF